jgi:hypothetical protein
VGGHGGGLAGGFLCGWIMTSAGPRHLRDDRATLAVVIGVAVASFVLALAVA